MLYRYCFIYNIESVSFCLRCYLHYIGLCYTDTVLFTAFTRCLSTLYRPALYRYYFIYSNGSVSFCLLCLSTLYRPVLYRYCFIYSIRSVSFCLRWFSTPYRSLLYRFCLFTALGVKAVVYAVYLHYICLRYKDTVLFTALGM